MNCILVTCHTKFVRIFLSNSAQLNRFLGLLFPLSQCAEKHSRNATKGTESPWNFEKLVSNRIRNYQLVSSSNQYWPSHLTLEGRTKSIRRKKVSGICGERIFIQVHAIVFEFNQWSDWSALFPDSQSFVNRIFWLPDPFTASQPPSSQSQRHLKRRVNATSLLEIYHALTE